MPQSRTDLDTYPAELHLDAARNLYFQRNGFAADGGYSQRWVTVMLGPLPFSFPNSAARVRAVRYHDLHHIVTGYQTTLRGEAEIAAFELASGCTRFPAAFHLNLGALAIGSLIAPGRCLRAFARGRRGDNLYARELTAPLLAQTVGAMRSELGLDEPPRVSVADVLRFGALCALALPVALSTLLVALPLAALAWPFLTLAKRRGGALA
jgi:hypothetical protein